MSRDAASRRTGLPGLAAWLLVAVLAAPGALGQGVAVEGSDRARIRPPARDAFPPYANAGYELSHGEEGEVVVEVSLEPLASSAPFPPAAAGAAKTDGPAGAAKPSSPSPAPAGSAPQPSRPPTPGAASEAGRQPVGKATPGPSSPSGPAGAAAAEKTSGGDGEVARLARRLTAEARTQHGAVSRVLGWMARHVADSTATGGNALIAEDSTAVRAGSPTSTEPPAAGAPAGAPKPGAARPGAASPEAAKPGVAQPGAAQPGAVKPASGAPPAGKAGARAAAPADPQAPEEVLARRNGDPVGVARLAVALLTAAGVEARVVRGVVAGTPEPGGASGRHAWIEVRYPDRGWVFSDPLRHHHFVPATYLRAASRPDEAPAGPVGSAAAEARPNEGRPSEGRAGDGKSGARLPAGPNAQGPAEPGDWWVLERRDLRKTVDLYPPGAPGVTARRNRPEQLAAALRVVVAGGGRALAVLEGPDGRVSRVLPGGEGVFVGLAGGRYRLEVFPDGGPPVVRQVDLQARERGAVFVRQDSAGRPAVPRPGATHRGGRRTSQAP